MTDDPGNILRRGLADLEAGRVSDFEPRGEPTCGLWWMFDLVAILWLGMLFGFIAFVLVNL